MSRKSTRTQPIDETVGSQIRLLRLRQGMSQNDLSQKLGISYQQLHKYENGSNSISASRLAEIAAALNVSVETLFDANATAASLADDAVNSADADISQREEALLQHYLSRIIHPEKRQALKELLASLIDSKS